LGTEKGLEVWDKLREAMGDDVAGQVLFGILKGHRGNVIQLEFVGDRRIDTVKLIRECTGFGLKEAKDIMDSVIGGRPREIEVSNWYGIKTDGNDTGDKVDYYIRQFEAVGCRVS
jgi:hypothetical protein